MRKKTKLLPFVDYYPLKNFNVRVKPENLRNEPTILPPGTINKNSWKDVVTYCQLHGYRPADIYKLIFDRHKPKTKTETHKIGILIYDAKLRNARKKKADRHSERAIIIVHCRHEIFKILPKAKKDLSDMQLYRVGKKALERTPDFLLKDKKQRKQFGY